MNLKIYKKNFEKVAEKNIYDNMHGDIIEKYFPFNFAEKSSLSVDKGLFYNNRKEIDIESSKGGLLIQASPHSHKQVYVSYMTLDNNFNEIPANPLIKRTSDMNYYLSLNYEENGISIRPFLVFYNQVEKTRLHEIIENSTKIIFRNGEESCRLTFKLENVGKAKLKNIMLHSLKAGDSSD